MASVAQRLNHLEAIAPELWPDPEPEPERVPLASLLPLWAAALLWSGPDGLAAAMLAEYVLSDDEAAALVSEVFRRTEAREWPQTFNCRLAGHLTRALARDGTRFRERGCYCLPRDLNPLPPGPEYRAWESSAWRHLSAWSAWQPYPDEGGPEPEDISRYLGQPGPAQTSPTPTRPVRHRSMQPPAEPDEEMEWTF